MHIASRGIIRITLLACALDTAHLSGSGVRPPRGPDPAHSKFELSVDSIMRGPKLVGYPPTGLRWSGDSSRLYFEWRRPGDEEPATWVVNREGGEPRKLSDEERRNAPPVNGVWDHSHRRVLFVDEGDIVLLDSGAGTRRMITRTSGAESNPRWAKHESAVTFVRENNLFIVPLDGTDRAGITQLTDVTARKRDPRETDSQKFIKSEEQKLIEHTRVQAEKKKKVEEKEKAHALPTFELAERQSATDLQLAPDDKHVFMLIVERTDTAKRPNVPNYVTESSYTEDIPARTFVGDAQDKRMLAVMNLESGKTVWADSSFAGTARSKPETGGDGVRPDAPDVVRLKPDTTNGGATDAIRLKPDTTGADENTRGVRIQPDQDDRAAAMQRDQDRPDDARKPQSREVRWGMPIISGDGSLAIASARGADNKDRWLVAVDPDGGKSRVLDVLHDEAWVREIGGFQSTEPAGFGWLADAKHIWFLSERDGWMQLYAIDAVAGSAARQLTQGKWEIESVTLSLDKKTF